ncbi:MAG: DUF2628 domain-containing protein [Propylenella sp.]
MRVYTVHAPPADPAPERFAFVKDGFSWPAFLVPVLWILWHRMWLTLIGYVIYALIVAWIGRLAGDGLAMIVAIAGALVLGLEGNAIRRLSLENRGWRGVGETFGHNLSEAEVRFFSDWGNLQQRQRDALLASGGPGAGVSAPESDGPILGLFPEPER